MDEEVSIKAGTGVLIWPKIEVAEADGAICRHQSILLRFDKKESRDASTGILREHPHALWQGCEYEGIRALPQLAPPTKTQVNRIVQGVPSTHEIKPIGGGGSLQIVVARTPVHPWYDRLEIYLVYAVPKQLNDVAVPKLRPHHVLAELTLPLNQ